MVQLHRERAKLEAAGARLYIIGNGGPSFIAGFREAVGYDGPVFTDPGLEVYEAAQLQRGLSTLLKPGAVTSVFGALRRGARQGVTRGDSLQQGGVLVIDRDHRVIYHHVSRYPGDNASPAEIASALG